MRLKKDSPLWEHWRAMLGRCSNKNRKQFKDYGGRGIKVCDQWSNDFWQFHHDMFPTYQKGLSLDRIDNNKDYSPENCKWSTKKEQQRNQRRTIILTIEGKKFKAIELSELSGIKVDVIVRRAELGLTFDQILKKGQLYTKLGHPRKTHCCHGHEFTIENTYISANGKKRCRKCRNEQRRNRYYQTKHL